MQLLVNVVLPTVVLLGLSNESRLGPARAMILALVFPVIFELYSLSKRRKPSVLSIVSIIGILITGAIILLRLSEDWLAIRRSAIYIIAALALLISMLMKRSLIALALPYVLDMDLVQKKARQNNTQQKLQKRINAVSYILIALLLAIGISSYILTLVVITAPTDTTTFNSEYVRLRVLSIPTATLPLFIGVVALLTYLATAIEKLTGLTTEQLFKKKKP